MIIPLSTLHRSRHAAQHGFTLVELMVSIAIGVFLAAGLVTLVAAMKRTSSTQSGLSKLEEDERLAMSVISDVIQSAGYWPNPAGPGGTTSTVIFPAVGNFVTAGQTIYGTHSTTAPNDTIEVRYASGGLSGANGGADNVINCSGTGSGAPSTYVNAFSLAPDPTDPNPTHMQLQCVLTVNGVTQQAPLVLVNGVTNLQILYGVHTNAAAPGNSVDTYLDAAAVNAGVNGLSYWDSVLSVKVTLSFVNPLEGQPGQNAVGVPISFSRIINVMNRAGVST